VAADCSHWLLARGFFYPEDGGDTFLQNIGSHKIYNGPHSRRRHSSMFRLHKTTEEYMKQVCMLILDNRKVTSSKVVSQSQISHGYAPEIVHHRCHFYKVFAEWVPKQLME
jgi:hypothetical protein